MEAARRMDVDLTVASEHDSTFSLSQPDRLLTLDFSDPVRAANQVRSFAVEYPITAICGIDDDTVVVASHASAVLGLKHNSVIASKSAGDKYRQRVVLCEKNVPVPRFRLADQSSRPSELVREVGFPCVIKPTHLAASRGVIRANHAEEFKDAFQRVRAIAERADSHARNWTTPGILVEDYVSGQEVALEGWVEQGRLQALALFDKPDPLEGPYFPETIYVTPSRLSVKVQAQLVDCAQQAVTALRLTTGPVHVELRYNNRGPWIIELAARPIGGKCGQVLRFGTAGSITLEQLVLGKMLGKFVPTPGREQQAVAVMMMPIPCAGTLRHVAGIEDALAVPHVIDVIITVHRGQRLMPLPDDSKYAGFIFARGDTTDEVERAVRMANDAIRLQIE
jgi:biotin carboxylase